MAVAKVIEVNASSEKSVEDAVRHGLKKTSETVKGIKGAWVNEIKAVTNDTGDITEWRVNLRNTFGVGRRSEGCFGRPSGKPAAALGGPGPHSHFERSRKSPGPARRDSSLRLN